MKVPISILRGLNVRVIIYLDDMLLIGSLIEEVLEARDTTIFLLRNLGFTINQIKSCLIPLPTCKFLGMIIDSQDMCITLPEIKVSKLVSLRQKTINQKVVSLRTMPKVIGKLHNACYSESNASNQRAPADPHSRPEEESELRISIDNQQGENRRVDLVDSKPRDNSGVPNPVGPSLDADRIRCIKNGLGSPCKRGDNNRGPVVSDRKAVPHQRSVTKCSGIGTDPSIDCFASRTMHHTSKYMSLSPDPEVWAVNAMCHSWDQEFPYLFPPCCLIGKVLKNSDQSS